jgi:hypothetical protein
LWPLNGDSCPGMLGKSAVLDISECRVTKGTPPIGHPSLTYDTRLISGFVSEPRQRSLACAGSAQGFAGMTNPFWDNFLKYFEQF